MQFYLQVILIVSTLVIFGIYFILNKEEPVVVTEETLRYVKKQIDDNAVFVAVKTWCPYCKATIVTLLDQMKVPASKIKVLKLNELKHGREIQEALFQMNGQKTVPHIYINQIFIGGNSDLEELRVSGKLRNLLGEVIEKDKK
ncbi:dithiol glutaredoxin GRX2 KNAG_0F00250 [Huiozyma naganishii CBS 8797]|uniref:Glutaredoxin domain-containing protein n=1 Tax=Huiozyma naganishii (strain ATCC MYA-139 / BCRC 22969 / CBS 8797 / KCTC 17520 / NBRC 10181 / NCYC 3082 / Yp74L-3) TaxID=1071383 RepID=J7RZN4_HUIN7|nr:hypothetical protein KNAG_0F00250 [Kazachstania naganishii CBS 8797]CCK70697.1 hypothetical protein KNAG_0F00250 [Kazachstania naganishii CBS 8797]